MTSHDDLISLLLAIKKILTLNNLLAPIPESIQTILQTTKDKIEPNWKKNESESRKISAQLISIGQLEPSSEREPYLDLTPEAIHTLIIDTVSSYVDKLYGTIEGIHTLQFMMVSMNYNLQFLNPGTVEHGDFWAADTPNKKQMIKDAHASLNNTIQSIKTAQESCQALDQAEVANHLEQANNTFKEVYHAIDELKQLDMSLFDFEQIANEIEDVIADLESPEENNNPEGQ